MHGGWSESRRSVGRVAAYLACAGLMAQATVARADTQTYVISSFDSIRVDAPVTVLLTTGKGASARGEGDRAMLERLNIALSGRALSISMRPARNNEKAGGAVTLHLSTGDLQRVMLAGGGSVTVDRLKGLRRDIILGGSGDINVQSVDADRLNISLAGGGRVTLSGRAGVADLRVSGSGAIAADGLTVRQATLTNEGPGAITVTAVVSANIRASGSGDVTVLGKAACTTNNLGTGRIVCAGENY